MTVIEQAALYAAKEKAVDEFKRDLDGMSRKNGTRFGFTSKQIADMLAGFAVGYEAGRRSMMGAR
jgi:hypothetical protein